MSCSLAIPLHEINIFYHRQLAHIFQWNLLISVLGKITENLPQNLWRVGRDEIFVWQDQGTLSLWAKPFSGGNIAWPIRTNMSPVPILYAGTKVNAKALFPDKTKENFLQTASHKPPLSQRHLPGTSVGLWGEQGPSGFRHFSLPHSFPVLDHQSDRLPWVFTNSHIPG